MEKTFEIFKQIPLFNGLNEDDINKLLKCLTAKLKKYKKGETIIYAGNMVTSIGILLEGKAQIIKEDITGNRVIIGGLAKGEIFGEAMVCAHIKKSPVSVIAVTDCEVLFIEYIKIVSSCTNACEIHRGLVDNLITIIAEKNMILTAKNDILSKRTIREKIMTYLNFRMNEIGSPVFTIPFDRAQLADFLSVDRSALSRELANMQKDGLIEYWKNSFKVLKSN